MFSPFHRLALRLQHAVTGMAWLEALFWLILRWTLYAVAAALTLALLLLPRFLWVLPRRDGSHNSNSAKRTMPCKTALVLGSGGHTTELLLLLSSLDPAKYTPRTYFVSSGDTMSSSKADKLESGEWCSEENLDSSSSTDSTKSGRYEVVILPRARNVHQSWLSTPLSTLLSFAACVRAVIPRSRRAMPFTDLVLMNGPGTCVPLVAAVYVNKVSDSRAPAPPRDAQLILPICPVLPLTRCSPYQRPSSSTSSLLHAFNRYLSPLASCVLW